MPDATSAAVKSILILAANPKGTSQLQLDQEVEEIRQRLERANNRERFLIHSQRAARADELRQILLSLDPQIVHFSGHGAGDEGLAFETETGQVQLVSASALAGLFELFDQVECVLLNACYSEGQAEAISQHVDYVIGMSQAIQDRAALKFAAGFYDALGAGKSIEVAYKFGCNAIQLEGIPQHLVPVLKQKPKATADGTSLSPLRPASVDLATKPIEIFFSYVHQDESLREQFNVHLGNLQRQSVIQQWHDRQILPGTEWDGAVHAHLHTADIILLLLSADFMASNYCWDIEVKQALKRHEAEVACVIPVLLRPVDWQDCLFSHLQPLPRDRNPITRWPDQDEAFLHIVQELRTVILGLIRKRNPNVDPAQESASRSFSPSSAGSTPTPYENLPRSGVVEFVGRTQDLIELHQQLYQTDQARVVAISGMGGVGKTELALQYARSHLADYPGGVCWLPVRSGQLETAILDFARLYFNLTPPTEMSVLQQVTFCWQHWASGEVLLVLDDVTDYEQIKPFLPSMQPRFKILITTRRQMGASISKRSLDVLPTEPALTLLRSLIRQERIDQDQAIAEQLCEALGYLPLGLELVGRYLSRKPDLTLAKMHQRLLEKGLRDRATQVVEADMTTQLGLEAAFDLSWEILPESAQRLACLLSLFAPTVIPWTLVERCESSDALDDLEDIRDEYLINLHLLQRKQEGLYQLNQLIRRFLQTRQERLAGATERVQQFCRAMIEVAQQVPEDPTRDLIMALRPAIPHLAEAATTFSSFLSDDDLIKPFEGLGRFYQGQGWYDQAAVWFERCRQTIEQRLGANHQTVTTSLDHLASVYRSQGRYPEAEPLYVQALEMRQRILGGEHPDVADSLNNLGLLYKTQGRYPEAEPLYVQALEMRQRVLGGEHPDVADSLNNLALLYAAQGQNAAAEPLFIQALEMRQRVLGAEHPRIATSLNNLAYHYTTQGRFTEAELLYLQALERFRRLLGDEHPDVAISLNNLAKLYDVQERYADAEPLLVQALELNQRVLGTQHPTIAASLNNLAAVYAIQDRYSQAEPLYLQALEMRQRTLGLDHPHVAITLNNLAKLYVTQARYREAKPLYQRSLALLEARLGAEHAFTQKVRSNFEQLLLLTQPNPSEDNI